MERYGKDKVFRSKWETQERESSIGPGSEAYFSSSNSSSSSRSSSNGSTVVVYALDCGKGA